MQQSNLPYSAQVVLNLELTGEAVGALQQALGQQGGVDNTLDAFLTGATGGALGALEGVGVNVANLEGATLSASIHASCGYTIVGEAPAEEGNGNSEGGEGA